MAEAEARKEELGNIFIQDNKTLDLLEKEKREAGKTIIVELCWHKTQQELL